jgi:putative ABC transport system permease protein
LKQLPMVRSVAVSTDLPLSSEHPWSELGFQVAGRTPLPPAQRPQTNVTVVSSEYFQTVGIPLRSGRTFDVQDSPKQPNGIVVNEAFARKIFPDEYPLGHSIVGANGLRWTIVGVVGNVRSSELGAEPAPLVYRCVCQGGNRFLALMRILVRTSTDPRSAIRAVEGQMYAVDRNQPVFDVKTMDERLSATLAPQRFQLLLIGTFAAMAIILAAIGVYGVMSYLVTRRTREIGIRIAVGARPAEVQRLVLSETMALAGVAAVCGVLGALGLTRYLSSMLYGVTTLDAVTFALAPALLVGIATAASFVPARRAARVDPIRALREE